jgi:DNA-binding NarL/FixJ family response regulator
MKASIDRVHPLRETGPVSPESTAADQQASAATAMLSHLRPRTRMPIRILLADDHLVVREGLRALLEREGFEVVGEADNGLQAVEMAREMSPQVVVLDFDMPQMNGITAAQKLTKESPKSRLLLLTMYTDRQYVVGALRAGVHGFVIKNQAVAELVQAIRMVHEGRIYLSPGISSAVVEACTNPQEAAAAVLTPREQQVLQLVAEGKSTKEAARILEISVKTAESHRTRIMAKLDVHDTASLVRYAIREGFIQA